MFEIKNVSMIYDMNSDEKMYALNGVDLQLPDQGLVGVIGPSGSGKSTLMYCLSTLKSPTEGSILYNGQEITKYSNRQREVTRRGEFGFVFQKHYLVPYMDAIDNVIVAGNEDDKTLRTKAAEFLTALGLKEREFHKKPSKLSGGQCQRVAIARAMVGNPELLLADEPTGALDTASGNQIMEIFRSLADRGMTIIMITHEPSIAACADKTYHILDGELLDSVVKDSADLAEFDETVFERGEEEK